MQDLNGKTALITGAAEGIGFHTARILARQGMSVMLTDINGDQLTQSVNTLKEEGFNVEGVVLDVSKQAQWAPVVEQTVSRFGAIHFLMSNAGVSAIGGQQNISEQDWRWVMDVNVMGVVYGCQALMPHMRAHAEGAHIMNVASMAGMRGIEYAGPYCASKAAVVSLSESWRVELARYGIEVSVLCPGFVQTRIYDSARNRQAEYGGPQSFAELVKERPSLEANRQIVVGGIEVEKAAGRVLEGLLANEAFIFTHPEFQSAQWDRAEMIKAAFEQAADSPALKLK